MAGPNTSWSSREDVNSKKENDNIFTLLISEFSREQLKNNATRSQYVEDLRTAGSINPELLAKIKLFAWWKPKYDGLEIIPEKLNYHALVRETGAFYTTIENNRRSLKDVLLQEYGINESTLSWYVDAAVRDLDEVSLQLLLKSDKKRESFLLEHTDGADIPKKSIWDFLKDLDLETKYDLLDEGHKADFIEFVQRVQSGGHIEDIDLEILLEWNVYSEKEKELLINKFVPSISLDFAKRVWIITDAQALDLKTQQVRANSDDLTNDDIEDIVQQIQDSDIKIATSHFTTNKENRKVLIDNAQLFHDFAQKYNKSIDEVQSKIQSWDMRKASDFIDAAGSIPHLNGIEKLTTGSIFEIHQTVSKSNDGASWPTKLYGEVVWLENDGQIKLKEKSSNGQYDESGATINTYSYSEFLWYLSAWNANKWISVQSVEIYTPAELEAKIRAWDIDEYRGETLKLQGKDEIISSLDANKIELDQVQEALRAKEVQMRNDLSAQWLSSDEINERIDDDPWVQKHRTRIDNLTNDSRDINKKLDNLWAYHFEKLKKEIDEIDDPWKQYDLRAWTVFKTKKGDVYSIASISDSTGEVILDSVGHPQEPVSFENFYKGFKDKETKRVWNQASDFSELMERVKKEEWQSIWEKFELKSGALQKKSGTGVSYDYLVWSRENGTKELLHIHDITWDKITVSFGEIKEDKKKDNKDKDAKWADGKQIYDAEFKTENKTYIVTTWYLEDYIKENHLEPRSLSEAKDVSKEDSNFKKLDKKFRFGSWFFHEKASFNDAIKGGQIFYEQFKEMLEMGSEEKANQFALKYLWKVMTKDARRDLQSRLEVKQKSTMDDYIERLEKVASDVALEMIEQWLQDKYSPEFQKEAAVVFMLKKYWVLNAKSMSKHEWEWWWYQALGGEYEDELFMSLKAEKEALSLPFTEEYAVYMLIKKQCHPDGYKWVKRRSKLHKEVKKIRATWKEEEIETGKRDGWDERTVEWRVIWAMWEMESGNYPNMVWWMEKVIDKWGPMHVLNKVPFCAAMSGIAYSFEEKITDVMKSFPGSSRIVMAMRFFSYHKDLDLLNKTIVGICESLQEKWIGKYSTIGDEANELFNKRFDQWWGWEKRLKKVESFYDKYGEDITKSMYMLNTWKEDDSINKMIFFEKDYDPSQDNDSDPKKKAKRAERAQTFTQYFDTMKGFMRASETSLEDKDLMTDAFLEAGTSGLDLYKISKDLLIMRQWHWKQAESGPEMWKEVEKEFRAIPQREYDDDPVKNKKMQMKILKYNLQCFIAGILRKMQNGNEIAGYNKSGWPFNILNKWWIDMTNFENIKWFSVDDLLYGRSAEINKQIEKFASNIMNAEKNGMTYYHEIDNIFSNGDDNSVDTIWASVQSQTAKTLKKNDPRTSFKVPNDIWDILDGE